jgi:hypothetical protein
MKRVMGKLEKLCIKWLNENFNPMEPFFMKEYPDYVFHMKDGKCILQYNKKNGYVYVSYREIWKFFESYFSMDNQQIKDITKIWVEEHYKMGVTSISKFPYLQEQWAEEHYKMGVTSTFRGNGDIRSIVEEHYKVGVTSIQEFGWRIQEQVEEHYNLHTNG